MNFQNIPRDDKVVKRAFVPKRGAFSFFDYSQIEPRLFAYYAARSGDDTIAQWYREGRDVYREIAGRVFKKPSTEITEEERQDGKVWFLMSLYSAGPKKIAEQTGLSYAEAKQFYLDFHEGIPQIKMLSNPKPQSERAMRFWEPGGLERAYQRRGYIKSLHGRHLHAEQFGEHKLLNKLIQGSAADVMIAAILRVDRFLRSDPDIESRMVSVIHDELIFDGPEDEVDWLHEAIPPLMVDPVVNEFVPVVIDHEVSATSWAEKKSYEEWAEAREEVAV